MDASTSSPEFNLDRFQMGHLSTWREFDFVKGEALGATRDTKLGAYLEELQGKIITRGYSFHPTTSSGTISHEPRTHYLIVENTENPSLTSSETLLGWSWKIIGVYGVVELINRLELQNQILLLAEVPSEARPPLPLDYSELHDFISAWIGDSCQHIYDEAKKIFGHSKTYQDFLQAYVPTGISDDEAAFSDISSVMSPIWQTPEAELRSGRSSQSEISSRLRVSADDVAEGDAQWEGSSDYHLSPQGSTPPSPALSPLALTVDYNSSVPPTPVTPGSPHSASSPTPPFMRRPSPLPAAPLPRASTRSPSASPGPQPLNGLPRQWVWVESSAPSVRNSPPESSSGSSFGGREIGGHRRQRKKATVFRVNRAGKARLNRQLHEKIKWAVKNKRGKITFRGETYNLKKLRG